MIVWLNGALVAATEARIDPSDRGFLLADGLFETLRVTAKGIVDLGRHIERLRASAALLGIAWPLTQGQLTEAVRAVLSANGFLVADASVRITLTRGPGPRGLAPPADAKPTMLVTANVLGAMPTSLRLMTATTRRNAGSLASRLKTLAYIDNVLAKREALAAGADDALMLNGEGRVACVSAANIWLVESAALVTPAAIEGALPGIVRGRIVELAPSCGYEAREEQILPARLALADGAFVSNSLMGLVPVSHLDGKAVANNGAVETLVAAYWRAVSYE